MHAATGWAAVSAADDEADGVIWTRADRVVACARDGGILGVYDSVASARRALAGRGPGWFRRPARRPRYARTAA